MPDFLRISSTAFRYAVLHSDSFITAFRTHFLLSFSTVFVAALFAVPLGFACTRRKWLQIFVAGGFTTLRVVPGLAILALMLPWFGLGWFPAALALVFLAFPSILLNTMTGFQEVGAERLEIAQGLGMSPFDIFRKVELPLAMPAILNGLRIACVEVISGATLAAFTGGGGLGTFIVNGLSMAAWPLLLVGAVPVAIMALGAECLFSVLTRRLSRGYSRDANA